MTFIKSLKMLMVRRGQDPLQISKRLSRCHKFVTGQASLEYFIIFSIVALLTILSLSGFLPKVQTALQGTQAKSGFFQRAVLSGLDIDNNGR